MTLETSIRDILLKEISDNMSYIGLVHEARKHHKVIDFAYSNGIVTDSDLDSALTSGIERVAKWQLKRLRKQNIHPDHLYPVEIFAYGIEKVFSQSEISRIKFDHGETPESFVKTYGNENIITDYRKILLNPPVQKIPHSDGHCPCRV